MGNEQSSHGGAAAEPPASSEVPHTPTKTERRSKEELAPSNVLNESWGTSQRMAAIISTVDQEGVDEMVDRAMRMNNAPRFIAQFYPQSTWLWKQWSGTVLQQTWPPAATMMMVSLLLVLVMESARQDGEHVWEVWHVPDPDDRWVRRMKGFGTMWGYLLTMATFVNSFFLSQAYGFWLATKGNVRKVQGRLNDMGMLIAIHAERDSASGKFTPAAKEFLETIARWVRLYHMLFYAGQVRPARGDKGVSFSVLRTEIGLNGLLSRGALTRREFELLVDSPNLSEKGRHHAVLEWIMARVVEARRTGELGGGPGLDARFLEEGCKLRAVCASISDDAVARMPLSYVHLVQLLVDTLVVLAPFALYPKLGVLTVLLSGVLVVFYRGFLQLSKSFLDPFGNGDSLAENFSISCLLCETNAGSVRWFNAIDQLPFETKHDSGRRENDSPTSPANSFKGSARLNSRQSSVGW